MQTVTELAKRCKDASDVLRTATAKKKDKVLFAVADALEANTDAIIDANKKDIDSSRENGIRESMVDRLLLTPQRIHAMAEAVRDIAKMPDPIGQIDKTFTHANNMQIMRRRVPLGVVGVIYESRPNVTIDVATLCLKSGNACLLRGGKEAINSNILLTGLFRDAITAAGLPADCVCLVENTERSSANEMMGSCGLLDVLVPRGGAGLIKTTVENARMPVIETGSGNCHIYVDEDADLSMACNITINAKVSRPSVCNAAETLLVARPIAGKFLPMIKNLLDASGVELRGCPETVAILGDSVKPAGAEDWAEEYDDLILAVRVVAGMYEATAHIAKYGTKHSEAIITKNYFTAQRFFDRVDAAAVYCNASTRFTDGGEFGLGAELGISTGKMHARGPMGLEALTSTKYVIYGEGQIR